MPSVTVGIAPIAPPRAASALAGRVQPSEPSAALAAATAAAAAAQPGRGRGAAMALARAAAMAGRGRGRGRAPVEDVRTHTSACMQPPHCICIA
jgi:hypothetical protein